MLFTFGLSGLCRRNPSVFCKSSPRLFSAEVYFFRTVKSIQCNFRRREFHGKRIFVHDEARAFQSLFVVPAIEPLVVEMTVELSPQYRGIDRRIFICGLKRVIDWDLVYRPAPPGFMIL